MLFAIAPTIHLLSILPNIIRTSSQHHPNIIRAPSEPESNDLHMPPTPKSHDPRPTFQPQTPFALIFATTRVSHREARDSSRAYVSPSSQPSYLSAQLATEHITKPADPSELTELPLNSQPVYRPPTNFQPDSNNS